MPRAAILGTGVEAMFAAHACETNGVDYQIFGSPVQDAPDYDHFVFRPVPEIYLPFVSVQASLKGTVPELNHKSYGDSGAHEHPISVGPLTVFDFRLAYNLLWRKNVDKIKQYDFDSLPRVFEQDVAALAMTYDYVFSTLPMQVYCVNDQHEFKQTLLYAAFDSTSIGARSPVRIPDNQIIYCGDDSAAWVRATSVFGHCTVTWPAKKKPPVPREQIIRPIWTNCTCHPALIRIGQKAQWDSRVDIVDVFDSVTEHLTRRGVQGALF